MFQRPRGAADGCCPIPIGDPHVCKQYGGAIGPSERNHPHWLDDRRPSEYGCSYCGRGPRVPDGAALRDCRRDGRTDADPFAQPAADIHSHPQPNPNVEALGHADADSITHGDGEAERVNDPSRRLH